MLGVDHLTAMRRTNKPSGKVQHQLGSVQTSRKLKKKKVLFLDVFKPWCCGKLVTFTKNTTSSHISSNSKPVVTYKSWYELGFFHLPFILGLPGRLRSSCAHAPGCLRAQLDQNNNNTSIILINSWLRINPAPWCHVSYRRSYFWWSDPPWLDARCVHLLSQIFGRASSPTTLLWHSRVHQAWFREPVVPVQSLSDVVQQSTGPAAVGGTLQSPHTSRWNYHKRWWWRWGFRATATKEGELKSLHTWKITITPLISLGYACNTRLGSHWWRPRSYRTDCDRVSSSHLLLGPTCSPTQPTSPPLSPSNCREESKYNILDGKVKVQRSQACQNNFKRLIIWRKSKRNIMQRRHTEHPWSRSI